VRPREPERVQDLGEARDQAKERLLKCKFEPRGGEVRAPEVQLPPAAAAPKRKFGLPADGKIALQMPAHRVIERRPELYAERLAGSKLEALAAKFGGTPSSLSRHFRSEAGKAALEAARARAETEQAAPLHPGSSGRSARDLQRQRALVRAEQMLAEALQDPGLADRCGSGEHERACARVQRAHRALAEAKSDARKPASAPARQRGTRIQAFQVGGLSW
jgi:AraC-like DNA-binding protein